MWKHAAIALGVLLGACGGDDGPTGPYFTHSMFFDQDVSGSPKSQDSMSFIAALRNAGGWGNGDSMEIDFSFDVLTADTSTPTMTFTPNTYFFNPDCDNVAMPVPDGGDLEGETGYECTNGGDCHLLVYQKDSGKLFEMWKADMTGGTFSGGCLAVWDTKKEYGRDLRGMQCTSADAAGFPISAMLFTADEVAAGHIDHAIRLIMPNDRVRKSFVAPATHGTDTSGDDSMPAYGFHLRLRADYPIESLPSEGAKVVARAMQTYGMYHSDGGEIALTAASDRHTTAKWDGLLGAEDLSALTIEDFEVIDHGAATRVTNQCKR